MNQNFIKIASGAAKALQQSTSIIRETAAQHLDEQILQHKYVTRQEYDILRKLVLKLEAEISLLKNATSHQNDKKTTPPEVEK